MPGTDWLEIAERHSAAIMSRDAPAFETLYHDDLIVWHSYDRGEQGKAENIDHLRMFFGMAREIRYENIRRTGTDKGYVQQHDFHATLADGTELAPRPCALIVELRDGKMYRIDEYIEARKPASEDS